MSSPKDHSIWPSDRDDHAVYWPQGGPRGAPGGGAQKGAWKWKNSEHPVVMDYDLSIDTHGHGD